MKIGLVSDIHAGYTRGTREEDGVNVRETDVLNAASSAIASLVAAKVDVVVDLGDLFHVPHPKKRALLCMIHEINQSGLDFYSVNGNHTLVRTRSDIHIYDVLSDLCPKFHGYVEPALTEFGAYMIPYGYESEALQNVPSDALFIAGHFACDDVPWPGEHVSVKDLPEQPTFLGHYHTRKLNPYNPNDGHYNGPVYIGATERFAWGEATNPTGVATFDTKTKKLEFIEHETREWMDVNTNAEQLLDDLRKLDVSEKIVRVNVEATVPAYHGLDIKAIRDLGRGALEFQIRRTGSTEAFTPDTQDTQTYSLLDAWRQHTERLKPAALRKEVRTIGERALSTAGVGE